MSCGQDRDPFERFNSATGSGRVRNPYALFATLRERAPVFEGRLDKVFGLTQPDVFGNERRYFVALAARRAGAHAAGDRANHDPVRWDDPEKFDIQRPSKAHVAFATGPHTCLGLHLARMETSVALNALFDRLPNLRLDPEAEDVHITGLTFRAPERLPVVFG